MSRQFYWRLANLECWSHLWLFDESATYPLLDAADDTYLYFSRASDVTPADPIQFAAPKRRDVAFRPTSSSRHRILPDLWKKRHPWRLPLMAPKI